MRCNILRNLYIKSNGDIRCDDDYGERVLLGRLNEDSTFSPSLFFNNGKFQKIRHDFENNQLPWGNTCQNCAFLTNGEIEDSFAQKNINKIQLETSLLCALKCPACSREKQIKLGRKPLILSLTKLENLLKGLVSEKFSVKQFEFCGQGEPLNHPEFSTLFHLIKKYYPNANTSLVTNGNFDYLQKLSGCSLTEIIVSVDGSNQSNYQTYRVGGTFEKCVQFMRDIKKFAPACSLVWKYILFNHNDSDNDILAAQAIANELEVDELRFVGTNYGPASNRLSTNLSFPITYQATSIAFHPYIKGTLATLKLEQTKLATLKKFIPWRSENIMHHLDRAVLAQQNGELLLFIDGWLVANDQSNNAYLCLGKSKKKIVPIFARPDVAKIHQCKKTTGFRVALQVTRDHIGQEIELRFIAQGYLQQYVQAYQIKVPSLETLNVLPDSA
ncbi:radical SAM protein [Neptunicella marina]|uniref:Radical SAM protein n=1 Tax=Neptunicella marina TaxID=2125989 RepID=A0A8J6J0W6_9ALTE|nr:radical SAM protein [Neptunicella marina]MBC3767687.1 radical SAM protein [Neptunicella marina]